MNDWNQKFLLVSTEPQKRNFVYRRFQLMMCSVSLRIICPLEIQINGFVVSHLHGSYVFFKGQFQNNYKDSKMDFNR